MEYITLGKSDLEVSRICLGCMGFGDPENGQHSWTVGEDETLPYLAHAGMAATPYSALASGRLSRLPGAENTKRLEEDAYAKFKYDATAEAGGKVVAHVAEVAEQRGATMTEVALAWLLAKVASPVVGAMKLSHVEGAAKATELELAPDEITYLEEPYVPHARAGHPALAPAVRLHRHPGLEQPRPHPREHRRAQRRADRRHGRHRRARHGQALRELVS